VRYTAEKYPPLRDTPEWCGSAHPSLNKLKHVQTITR
jgi:hypothetical protein